MKNLVLIVIITIFCLLSITSCSSLKTSKTPEEPKDITLNLADKKFTNLDEVEKLNKGDLYRLRIEKINLNLYKVSYQSIDTFLHSNLKMPGFDAINIDAIAKLIASSNKSSFSGVLTPSERMDKALNDLINYSKNLNGFKIEIDNLYFSIHKYQLKSLSEFDLNTTAKCLNDTNFNFCNILEQIETLRTSIDALKKRISDSNEVYTKFTQENKKTITDNQDLKKRDDDINNYYTRINAICDSERESLSASKTDSILTILINIDNNSNHTYISLPMQFNGEQSKLNIIISPYDKTLPLQTYSTQIVFPSKRRSYFGVGVSFYGSGLYDDAYSVQETKGATTSTFKIVDEKPMQNEFGTAALFKFGSKLSSTNYYGQKLGFHGQLGPGISISNSVRPRLLYGVGLSYGSINMLTIDIGYISGNVDRKSNVFEVGTEYSDKPTNIIISKLETSLFVSVGYLYRF